MNLLHPYIEELMMFLCKPLVLPFTLCAIILQGCSSGASPKDSNIFGAIGGLSGGGFERQTQQKRNDAARSRQEKAQEQARQSSLLAQENSLRQQKQQLIGEVRQIAQENNILQRKIDSILVKGAKDKIKQGKARAKLRKIKQKTQQLNAKLNARNTARDEDINQYQSRKRELRREIAALRSDLENN